MLSQDYPNSASLGRGESLGVVLIDADDPPLGVSTALYHVDVGRLATLIGPPADAEAIDTKDDG